MRTAASAGVWGTMRLRPSKIAIALGLVAGLGWNGPADASDRSARLYSRALVELHAGHNDRARQLLDDAVNADPTDAYALYYRGTIRGRLGDLGGAVADLRAALALRPDLDEAALDLGVALDESGKPVEAIPPLEQASRRRELEATARLYLGIAQLHADRPADARANLAAVSVLDPRLAPTAEYYLGLASQRAGETEEAERHFAAAEAAPDTAAGREARDILQRMREGGKPWTVYGSVGFQYDSNVVLAGNDVGISRKDDGRAVIDVGGAYSWRLGDALRLSTGYEFFQSLHFDLHEFNLQDHRPEIRLLGGWDFVRFGLLARYDFYLRDGSAFLNQATGSPWISVDEAGRGRLDTYYRVRLRDFLESRFDVRDSVNQAPGIRQVFYLGAPERYFAVGYQFDREDPNHNTDDANSFAYDGHEVNFALGCTFPFGLSAEADYAYRQEQYPAGSRFTVANPTREGRLDKVHQVALLARQPIWGPLRVVVGYFGDFNGSNDPTFDYDRHIASIALEVSL
jgi:tetratricopeptide (TPR) repeat protein